MCGCIKSCCDCLCSCAIGLLKIIIFVFNVFFWLAGLALIIISAYLLIENPGKEYDAIIGGVEDDMWLAAMYTMLAAGIFMFLAGFMGCCGTCKEDSCMLCWYSILMTCVLVIQCTIGIFLALQIEELDDYLEKNLEDQVKYNYTGISDDPMTEAWDALQENVECCGSHDYGDYRGSYYHTISGNLVPESCCVMDGDNAQNYTACRYDAGQNVTESDYLHVEGCYSKGSDIIDEYAAYIYITVYIIAAIEIACIIIGCCLYCSVKKRDNEVEV